jgi:hypothetical protein
MRGHGFATLASTVELAVFRAIYAQTNAEVQRNALTLASSVNKDGKAKYLSEIERIDTQRSIEPTSGRPWRLWVREVETYPGGLYQNTLGSPPGA